MFPEAWSTAAAAWENVGLLDWASARQSSSVNCGSWGGCGDSSARFAVATAVRSSAAKEPAAPSQTAAPMTPSSTIDVDGPQSSTEDPFRANAYGPVLKRMRPKWPL